MKIMLAGKRGSGKDEAAMFLKRQYGGQITSFAEPLYEMMYFCQDTMGIERHKDRVFLTTMGDYFREINPGIFINLCMDKAYSTHRSGNNVFVSDGRYENELNAGKTDGFYLIQMVASDAKRQERRPEDSADADSHSSENGYPEEYQFDTTINNDGTLEELYQALEETIAKIILEGNHVIY
ncbi:MAG: hypothetical protein JHC33_12475 [Ignisphaera sp.]|nr:hypothetical protein [Ignisphaera sp.]